MIETEIQISNEARFYFNRLINLFETRDKAEQYPLQYYSSELESQGVHIDQLREAIKKSIFSSYRMLHALGYGNEADIMIKFDRVTHQ